jgi:hypothetical protein
LSAEDNPVDTAKQFADLLRNLQAARLAEEEALDNLVAAVRETLASASAFPAGDGSPFAAEPCYLSVRQLVTRIPYAEQTIRNLMSNGELLEGVHFFKRRGRVMFSWPAMRAWVERQSGSGAQPLPLVRNRDGCP